MPEGAGEAASEMMRGNNHAEGNFLLISPSRGIFMSWLTSKSDRLLETEPALANSVTTAMLDAISVLERNPLIGRPAEEGRHELVISRGKSGYVAKYKYFELQDAVLVLAIRHQREAGYQ